MPPTLQRSKRASTEKQLPYLETFSRAAELASFTRAAEAMCMTQAAVSQHVHALERELGVPLFRRHAGRVELTDAGRTLYEFSQKILNLHADARRALRQVSEATSDELHIAASTIPAEHFLTGLLKDFLNLYPHIHVIAEVADSAVVVETLEKGRVTVGLVGRRVSTAWADYQLFAKDRLVLIVPPAHAWRKRTSVSVEELRSQPLIVRGLGSGTRACLERALATRNLTLADFNVTVELGSNEAIKEAVLRGLGLAVLSIRAVEQELSKRRLREVPIEGLDLSRELYIVTDRRRALPAPARAFLRFLETHPLADSPS